MKIKKLVINDFRKFKNTEFRLGKHITVISGTNAVGKSTILEALEIFFNNKLVQIDIDDLNKQAYENGADEIVISCIFDDLPTEIDTTSFNHYLLRHIYL